MDPKERQDTVQKLKARNKLGTEDRQNLEALAHNIIHTLWEKVGASITNSDLGLLALFSSFLYFFLELCLSIP